uniref:Uncharacterized protein n=1 Tax=Tanacetum cinerariifolium TaxID=118510 RepID=A0A699I874_TANCI|nr:hypothetical protein [Tanacetum cinerariifolium]
MRIGKVDFPRFSRVNVEAWIYSRFFNAMFEDPMEEIASLIQDDDLHEYNNAFDTLLNKGQLPQKRGLRFQGGSLVRNWNLNGRKENVFGAPKNLYRVINAPRNQLFIIEVEDEDEAYEENKEDEDKKLP